MKIAIIGTHFWPIPLFGWKNHPGDYFYAHLAKTLDEMGHEVTFVAPEGSYIPPHGRQLNMPVSWAKEPPYSYECEQLCYNQYSNILKEQDVVHDFSISKRIVDNLYQEGYYRTICSSLSGMWNYPQVPRNFVLSSQNMKERALRGATDYEGTPTPGAAGPPQRAIHNAHVVQYGIDTDFYTPTYQKKDYFLWFGRWHPVRGYHLAIELAKRTGIKLVMAGEHPDRDVAEFQRKCALEAVRAAKGCRNIDFEWLPADPEHHEEKKILIQGAKALLFPVQFQEPFGLMQPEALACGTPVIGTNYGSVPEIIRHGVTGFVLNNKIEEFISAIDMIEDIIPAVCRHDAVSRFDRHVMATNFLKEYQKVINGESW